MIDKTFRAGEKFRPVRTETRKMQFLYDSGDAAVFMDTRATSSSSSRSRSSATRCSWVLPNAEVDVLFVDERPAGRPGRRAPSTWRSRRPIPGVKGDTASGGGTKPATLESGVRSRCRCSSNEGDRVRVDTRSGEYVSRA